MNLKPFFSYWGGKRLEIPIFEKYIPKDYKLFVDPFVGGGALYFYLNPKKAVINDTDPYVIEFYKYIKNRGGFAIQKWMNREPFNASLYKSVNNNDTMNQIYKWYFLKKYAFSGKISYKKDGIIRGSTTFQARRLGSNVITDQLVDKDYIDLLKRTHIYNDDYVNIMKRYNNKDVFMFLDPPYFKTEEPYFEDFTEEDQRELNKLFKESKSKILMIINDDPLIRELYKGYIKGSYRLKYESTRYMTGKPKAKHLIITNYFV